ncbi:MAG: hypothetical protein JWQ96_976 [Segetibacter sp.]|nr:hypothetical protein [Segetibacter sp.]
MNKKLLILVDWFVPGFKAGGPIRVCTNVAFALRDIYDVHVLTSDTDHGELKPYPNIISNEWISSLDKKIQVYYARRTSLSLCQIRRQLIEADADFIYLNHMWSPLFVLYPLWLKYRGIIKGKVILCPRGGLYESAIAVKSFKKRPLLKILNWLKIQNKILFHATNEREKKAIEAYFPKSSILIADDMPTFIQPSYVPTIKEEGILNCVFVARIVEIKNLLFLLDILIKVKTTIRLTIVGPIEDLAYWNTCKRKIEMLPGNVSVIYDGPKENSEVHEILQKNHLYILPSKGESFGHSILEALLNGKPVLISDQTPWLNLKSKKVGWDIKLDNHEAFYEVIEQAARWGQLEYNEYSYSAYYFAKTYIDKSQVKQDYLKLFSN